MNTFSPSAPACREQMSVIFNRCFYSEESGTLRKILHGPSCAVRTHAGRWIAELLGKSWQARARLFWGEEMTVLVPDGVGVHLRRYGYYEKNLTDFFLRAIKPGDVFMDVGAHFGYYTLLASAIVGAQGRVLSIEPTPRTHEVLRKNANRHDNITCVACAASAEEKDLIIQDFGTGRGAFNRIGDSEDGAAGIKVRGRRVDDVLKEYSLVPQIIKIDAEQYEMEVLKGLSSTLEEAAPILTLEVGDDPGHEGRSERLIIHMKKIGYEPYEIGDGRLIPHLLRKSYRYDNLAFLRPDRMEELKPRFRSSP
jgi:FkbM family methyltransferase